MSQRIIITGVDYKCNIIFENFTDLYTVSSQGDIVSYSFTHARTWTF